VIDTEPLYEGHPVSATARGIFESRGERAFMPPDPGEWTDWVLVLDDAAKRYPPPGAKPFSR
jgi:hypothetical protein